MSTAYNFYPLGYLKSEDGSISVTLSTLELPLPVPEPKLSRRVKAIQLRMGVGGIPGPRVYQNRGFDYSYGDFDLVLPQVNDTQYKLIQTIYSSFDRVIYSPDYQAFYNLEDDNQANLTTGRTGIYTPTDTVRHWSEWLLNWRDGEIQRERLADIYCWKLTLPFHVVKRTQPAT